MLVMSGRIELARAAFAHMFLVQRKQVVDRTANRALRLDFEQHESTLFDSDVQQIALAYAQDLPKFGRDNYPTQLVDPSGGADRSHVGTPKPLSPRRPHPTRPHRFRSGWGQKEYTPR
jgi:hypothetical protein